MEAVRLASALPDDVCQRFEKAQREIRSFEATNGRFLKDLEAERSRALGLSRTIDQFNAQHGSAVRALTEELQRNRKFAPEQLKGLGAALGAANQDDAITRLAKGTRFSEALTCSAVKQVEEYADRMAGALRPVGPTSAAIERMKDFEQKNRSVVRALTEGAKLTAATCQTPAMGAPIIVERAEVKIGREQLTETRRGTQETKRLREEVQQQRTQTAALTTQVNKIRAEASRRAREQAERSTRHLVVAVILTALTTFAATMAAQVFLQ